MITEPTNQEI